MFVGSVEHTEGGRCALRSNDSAVEQWTIGHCCEDSFAAVVAEVVLAGCEGGGTELVVVSAVGADVADWLGVVAVVVHVGKDTRTGLG